MYILASKYIHVIWRLAPNIIALIKRKVYARKGMLYEQKMRLVPMLMFPKQNGKTVMIPQ